MSLEGRVALVSGGGRGIGRAIAIGLAEDGADVAVNNRRDADAAAETVAAIEKLGRRAKAYAADAADYEQDKAMVEAVMADFGRIDILVHNAGIASRGRSVVDTDPSEPARLFATHAQAAHHLAALALPHMRRNGRGDIVVISSVATLGHAANGAPYNMAKAALEALALTLAKEEKPHGIFVNIVAPGLVDTDMGQRLARAAMGADDIHSLDKAMPFGHVCQPEEVAAVVRFLVSPANTYVTGEKVNVHGGGR
jgi:NAD(P)-dependent dehydrogenase (short-subunit alcohol dehydrogenase family)